MKKDLLHTPEGFRDIYNGECYQKKILEKNLHKVCHSYGYNDIETPTMEFFDVFNKERGSIPSNEMFKLFDKYGNTLVLRPDFTPSISRVAAKYFEDSVLPIKLCYQGNTFINDNKYYQGRLKENTVIGAELINETSLEADFEIIAMLIDCMKASGLKEFQVEVGNVAYYNGLLHEANISGEMAEELTNLIREKNYFGVEELLNSLNINPDIKKTLLELPQLFGSVEILDRAKQLTINEEMTDAITHLQNLYKLLTDNGYDEYISFDLGSLSVHSYYTGIIFSAYTFGMGRAVATGGRYDKLMGQFGQDKASIGFSIIIDAVMAAIERQGIRLETHGESYLLVYSKNSYKTALKKATKLRNEGIKTCIIKNNLSKNDADYLEYAKNAYLNKVIFIDDNGNERECLWDILQ